MVLEMRRGGMASLFLPVSVCGCLTIYHRTSGLSCQGTRGRERTASIDNQRRLPLRRMVDCSLFFNEGLSASVLTYLYVFDVNLDRRSEAAGGWPMTWSAGRILTVLYIGLIVLWLLATTALFTGLLPGWGLNQPFVLGLLLVWVVSGGWYGAWKTKREFHEQAGFGWGECLSRACLTLSSNILVAAMAPPLLFITTSSILRNASESIDPSTNEVMASSLAWGSFGVSLAAAGVAFIVLNEHIHSAISRKVRRIQLESERRAGSPRQSEGDWMIQTMRRKLKPPRVQRRSIALLAGASPLILALVFIYVTRFWPIHGDPAWIKFLVQNQEDIIQSLLISSLMVAVFCTLLRNRVATLLAGFQPAVIQAAFILMDTTRHIALNSPLAAVTVLPLLILLITLGKEIGQQDDQDREEKKPIDFE